MVDVSGGPWWPTDHRQSHRLLSQMSDPLTKANAAMIKHDWSNAAKHLLDAADEEPDFMKASDHVLKAASLFNVIRMNGRLKLG